MAGRQQQERKKRRNPGQNILSDSVGLQRVQVGAVEQRGGRVALGEGLGGHMRVPGDGTEEARRSRGRAVGGPQGKRRQLRQMGVKRRLRLRLRLAVHDGRIGRFDGETGGNG